jgi:hypothetical protein
VGSDDLPGLREQRDLVIDRGTKHPAKPLAALLLGHDRVPLLEGPYTSASQLLRSARTLLDHAARAQENNVFVLGVARPLFLGLFLGALAAAALLVAAVCWARLDERRLDYRALAEALRVRRAWALSGLGASVADSYLGQLRGELAWARRALLHLCPPARTWEEEFAALGGAEQAARLKQVRDERVKGQEKYFEGASRSNHLRATLYRAAGFALAVAGWLLAAALLADARHPQHVTLILSGLLVVCGGLFIAICERRSHEELAKQYERMHVVFKNGGKELGERLAEDGAPGATPDIPAAQATLEALGREAITENAQWLILRRARGFELHLG